MLPPMQLPICTMQGPSINYVTQKLANFDLPSPHVTLSVKNLIDLNKRKTQWLLRSAVGMTHVLRCELVMGYTT